MSLIPSKTNTAQKYWFILRNACVTQPHKQCAGYFIISFYFKVPHVWIKVNGKTGAESVFENLIYIQITILL